jgi:hypothetical protein
MKTAVYSLMLIACVAMVPAAFGQQRPVWQQKSDYLMHGPAGYSARSAGQRMYQAREYSQQLYDGARPVPAQSLPMVATRIEAEPMASQPKTYQRFSYEPSSGTPVQIVNPVPAMTTAPPVVMTQPRSAGQSYRRFSYQPHVQPWQLQKTDARRGH